MEATWYRPVASSFFPQRDTYMRLRIDLQIFAVVPLALLVSCSTTPTQGLPNPTATRHSIASTATGESSFPEVEPTQTGLPYPSPTAREDPTDEPRSYPAPPTYNATPQITYVVPQVTQDKGVVIGRLLDINTNEPLPFQSVYLGIKIPLTPGPAYNYALSEASSPSTLSDEDGRFAIGDVEPGEYILMLFHPSGVTVIMVPNSDRELDVIVTAGEMLDLGEVKGTAPVD